MLKANLGSKWQQLNGNPSERETEFTKDVRLSDSGCLSKARIHLRVKIMTMRRFIKVNITTPITKQVSKENTQFLEKKLVVCLDLLGIMLISGLLKYLIINSIFVTSKRRLIRVGTGMLETIHLLKQFFILRYFECLRSFKLSHIQI